MFIKSAMAAAQDAAVTTAPVTTATPTGAFSQTILFTGVLVVLFYLLLIRPQQKRYKEHSDLINKLGKGDKIVTQGGMIGTIDTIVSDKEVVVDFGNNIKMTVMRSSLMGKYEPVKDTATKK